MTIQKLRLDEPNFVALSSRLDAIAFLDVITESGGLEIVQKFRLGSERLLASFDERWIKLCNGDVTELTSWANRIRFIRLHFDEIDRQLLVKGSRLFNNETVATAMGYINAHRVAIEQTLNYNERLQEKLCAA